MYCQLILGKQLEPPGSILWSNHSNVGYKKLSACIEERYTNFTAYFPDIQETLHINGSRTFDENLADIGGIRMAYFAYGKYTYGIR